MMTKPSQSVSMTSCLSRSGVNQFLPRIGNGDGQDLASGRDACYTRWPEHG
jgi:hypothetical protein